MAKTKKYEHLFINGCPPNQIHPLSREKDGGMPFLGSSVMVDEENFGKTPGAFIFESCIVLKPSAEIDAVTGGVGRPHIHDFDEYLFFLGTNPDDPDDLGGEVEFWFGEGDEAEQYFFDKTTAIFIPKGVWHTPFAIPRVDRPFIMGGCGKSYKYSHLAFSDHPKYAGAGIMDTIHEITVNGEKRHITESYLEYIDWASGKKKGPKYPTVQAYKDAMAKQK